MNYRLKKQQDSLALLQKDLNQLGIIKYLKAKKAKSKIKAKKQLQKQKQNKSMMMEDQKIRLPPIYADQKSYYEKAKSFHHSNKYVLIQKLKQFENKVYGLQAENAIQKKQNQKLVDYVVKLKNNNKSLYQSSEYPQKYPMSNFYPPMAQLFPPYQQFMPPQMPYMNMNMPNMMNPYQMPYQQQNLQGNPVKNNQGAKGRFQKKKNKLNPLSRLRVAGYVVFFSIFFRKYSKSFTIHRFDLFKDFLAEVGTIQSARQKLKQYIKQKIPLSLFSRQQICQLDSLKNINQQQNGKQQDKKKKKNQSNIEQGSDDSSDFQSESSESQSEKKQKNTNKNESESQQPNIFQFYLKIDIAVAFVVQLIKQVIKCILEQQFQKQNPFLVYFLQREFQPDQLHEQVDFKYLNLHPEKGYSRNQKIITQYFLIKNIFLDIFVNKSLLNQLANKFYFENKKNQKLVQQNKVYFSFFIRTCIFKIMIQQYLKKKIQKCQTFLLPNQEITPLPRVVSFEDPLHNQAVTFQNNGGHMKQDDIQEISQEQIKKKQKQLKNILDESCQKLFKKLQQIRKKHYQKLKEKTLSQKYRTQENQYFKLHTKEQHLKDKQNFFKTTTSILQQSIQGSRLKASSSIARLKSVVKSKTSKYSNSSVSESIQSKKTSKKSFKENRKKKKPRKVTESSSQSSS